MSVVIVGGNECMVRRYIALCREYRWKAKVYPKLTASMMNIGSPELVILFTAPMSHKMLHSVLSGTNDSTLIARSHTSSCAALRGILDAHIKRS